MPDDRPDDAPDTLTTDPQAVFEREPIIEVFGKPGILRMMVVLIDAGGAPLTVSDIAEQADVNSQTFYNNEELLLDYGLIERADKVGNAQRYRVDMAKDTIQALMYLYDAMIDAHPDAYKTE